MSWSIGLAMAELYFSLIVTPGKQALFFLLVAFILTFLFIRFSVRMIRAGVSWWPGNITSGDVHVHHVVFGTVLMFVAGVLAFAPAGWESPWWEILGALFGVGAALVLDEFALILHLDDVYWSEQGRKSVDAVVLAAAVIALLMLGALPFGIDAADTTPDGRWGLMITIVLGGVLVGVALLKGRIWLGVLGLLVPLLALIGAFAPGQTAIAVGALAVPGGLAEDRPGYPPRAPARRALGAAQASGVRRRGRSTERPSRRGGACIRAGTAPRQHPHREMISIGRPRRDPRGYAAPRARGQGLDRSSRQGARAPERLTGSSTGMTFRRR
jgi:lysyl-tRNA synthetase class 2